AVDGDMEGIPVALMEAMAVGTPVVSTYHSGIPELIEHNVSGFLVGENDFLALADIIMDIRKRPFNEIIQVAKNARVKIELTFNRDASYREMLKYIQ
ncbi:TPA: glycosyltransferase, partial [Klebsiella pneumoniae]